MRAGIARQFSRHTPSLLVSLVVLGFVGGLVWWALAAETRSLDRRLDIAGQTLVEELHRELDEKRRAANRLARDLALSPPQDPASFTELVSDHLGPNDAAAVLDRTDDGLIVGSSTDNTWVPVGVSAQQVPGWDLETVDSLGLEQTGFAPPPAGDRRIVLIESIGSSEPELFTEVVLVGVSVQDLVAETLVFGARDRPTIRFAELSGFSEITTSVPRIHREYFLVGDRVWQFETSPREGTSYRVDTSRAKRLAAAGLVLVVASGLATDLLLRRRHARQELAISTGLSQEKDRFLLALSHQIRTPLTAVVGFLDLLRSHDDLDQEERDEFLNRAADHADEVAAIVHDILVVTRDDLDLLVVTAAPTNPIREATAVASSIPLGQAVIEIHPAASEAPIARADPVRVRQVLRNLVANAIRHGGEAIHISAHRLAGEVVVTVADDGPGLPEDVVTRLRTEGPDSVFDPERSDSLGLGLRVAWLLADRMRGRIEYRRSGSLTMFELILPAAPDEPTPERSTETVDHQGNST